MSRARTLWILVLLAPTACARHEEPAVQDEPAIEAPAPAPIATTVTAPPAPDVPTVVRPAPPEVALAWVRANSCADAAPMSLTASDGTGLRLASFDAKGVVEGPLAYTELHLSFDNPEARQLEGRFSIQLPPGAAVSRFAMAIGGTWQEGEVVERQAARVAYEDFLHRRQDPALLESGAGNRFEARVFPIAPGARKEIIISWSQALASAKEPYVLPVCGLPKLDALDVEVLVRAPNQGGEGVLHKVELHEKAYEPTMDLELRTGNSPAPILRSGDLAVARVTPAISAPDEPIETLTILFDTSASRALDFEGQIERLGALVAELGRRKADTVVRVIAFDQTAELVFDGPCTGYGTAQAAALRNRGALGASDLGVGLGSITKAERVLYVGDGVFTAGSSDRAGVLAQLRSLAAERGITRLDALIDGGLQDRAVLEDLVRGELERDGLVLDARVSVGQIADKLGRPTRSGLKVAVEGATWFWPQTVDGVQPGDAVLVYAELPADRALQVSIGDAAIFEEGSAVASAPRPLLQRARAQAKIEQLTAELAGLGTDAAQSEVDKRTAEIIMLSTSQRVLSEHTALLVLETEDDYRRFGIERGAMADILTVGERGVELIARGGLPVDRSADKLAKLDQQFDEKSKDKGGSGAGAMGAAEEVSAPGTANAQESQRVIVQETRGGGEGGRDADGRGAVAGDSPSDSPAPAPMAPPPSPAAAEPEPVVEPASEPVRDVEAEQRPRPSSVPRSASRMRRRDEAERMGERRVGDLVGLAEQLTHRAPRRRIATRRDRARHRRGDEHRAGLGAVIPIDRDRRLALPRLPRDEPRWGAGGAGEEHDELRQPGGRGDRCLGQALERRDDQRVADEHRERRAVDVVHRRPTAAHVGVVEARQIVVDQRRAVEELQRARARLDERRRVVLGGVGHRHAQARTDAGAAGKQGVTDRGPELRRRIALEFGDGTREGRFDVLRHDHETSS